MTMLDGFRPIEDVTADERARLSLGKLGVTKNGRYRVSVNDSGEVLLTPLAAIPARELIVWENADLRASLFRGLAQAAEGKTKRLDWVTADEDDDE